MFDSEVEKIMGVFSLVYFRKSSMELSFLEQRQIFTFSHREFNMERALYTFYNSYIERKSHLVLLTCECTQKHWLTTRKAAPLLKFTKCSFSLYDSLCFYFIKTD